MCRKSPSKFDLQVTREMMVRSRPASRTRNGSGGLPVELCSPLPADPHGYCGECLPTFKREMVACNRCQHHDTTFDISIQDDVQVISCARPKAAQIVTFATPREAAALRAATQRP